MKDWEMEFNGVVENNTTTFHASFVFCKSGAENTNGISFLITTDADIPFLD